MLVFGARGFIGSAVSQAVAQNPNFELVRVSRHPGDGYSTAELTAPDSLRAVIKPGDIVVNCAGYANAVDATAAGMRLFEEVNVRGVHALAKACVARGACQLVHMSSVAAMGAWSITGVDEQMLREPATPYARSKLQSEQVLEQFRDRLSITILRPTSIFGEGRGLAKLLCRLVSWPVVPMPAAGRASIPFCYVGNIVDGVALSLRNPSCYGQTFILGDERSYSFREIVATFARALGKRPYLLSIPAAPARAAAVFAEKRAVRRNSIPLIDRQRINTLTQSVSYSITKFREATGYHPSYDLDKAAERIALWYSRGAVS
ncbi:MAG: NAD-dependent epimerase/dehydratase family protein [Trueperaceae bacterium]